LLQGAADLESKSAKDVAQLHQEMEEGDEYESRDMLEEDGDSSN
jgi:hypothetical protein